MGQFDQDEEMLAKYQLQTGVAASTMNLGEELVHGAIASVVDLGTSVWNSITPERFSADTADLLSRVDKDALQIYNEHPDAVHTASLVGGILAPVGLAVKGLKMARAGAKEIGWFSEAGAASRLKEVETAFLNSKGASKILDGTRGKIYGAMAANALVDNVAMEAAIVLSMNAHPYMDDYMKDLGSNFLLGAAIGTGIGGVIGTIGARSSIKAVEAAGMAKSNEVIFKDMKFASEGSNLGNQLLVTKSNVDTWKDVLARSQNPLEKEFTLPAFTERALEHAILSGEAKMVDAFTKMSVGELEKIDTPVRDNIMKIMTDTLRFKDVEKVAFFDGVAGDIAVAPGVQTGFLQGAIDLVARKISPKTGEETLVHNKAVFIPGIGEEGVFISLKEARNYGSLADAGETIDSLKKVYPGYGRAPRPDQLFERELKSTAELAADDARSVLFANSLGVDDLNRLVLHPEDLAMTKAVAQRVRSLPIEEAMNVRVTLTKSAPTYDGATRIAIKEAGFSADYLKQLKTIDDARSNYHVFDYHNPSRVAGMSEEGHIGLSRWIGGHKEELRAVALEAENYGVIAAGDAVRLDQARAAFRDLKAHPRNQAFRAKMSALADPDGFVLLYRGMSVAPKGHNAIESYSLNQGKAGSFATVGGNRLHRVHVDDILGLVEDMGNTGKGLSNSEVLVLNKATRESAVVANEAIGDLPSKFFSTEGQLAVPEITPHLTSTLKAGIKDLESSILETEQQLYKRLSDLGYKDESIAKRMGMTPDAFNGAPRTSFSQFTSEADILAALQPEKRALVLSTNLDKVPHAEIRSRMNAADLDTINADLVSMVLNSSKDEITRGVGALLGTENYKILLKYMNEGIDQVTTGGLGKTLFRSANSAVEKFGPSGAIAVNIGKDVTHYVNQTTEKLIKPIHSAIEAVIKNDALVWEHNAAISINASLKGNRIYRDGQFFQAERNTATGEMEEVAALYKGKEFIIQSKEVRDLFDAYATAGRSMYELNNASNKILGKPALSDIGFWVPSFNPRNKEIAYVVDGHGTSILWAKTAGELNDKVVAFEASIKAQGLKDVHVITKDSSAEHYNKLMGREDSMNMQMADVALQHSGSSASAAISTNTELLTEMINSYDHYIASGITNLVDIHMSPVMEKLKIISELSQRGHNKDAMGVVQKGTKAIADPGMVMRNVILGKGLLSEHKSWSEWQQRTQVSTDIALQKLSEITLPIGQKLGSRPLRDEKSWETFNAQLKEKGYTPYEGVEDFLRYQQEGKVLTENVTPRAIALFNSMAATSLLKFLELAHPFVNLIGMPILASGALRRINAPSFMGATLDTSARFSVATAATDAVRWMNHPIEGAKWSKLAEDRNIFDPIVSEANAAMQHTRSLDPGLIAKGEAFMKSSFIENASFASNWSETMSRKLAFFTGVGLAKKAYPGLSDVGVMTYARSFMDEAIGNYSSAQRPAMFQGTFGVAMGLFQTYMLTLAQQMYRGIETKDWVGLSKQMFAQTSIFGAASLPGFHLVSEQIGTHFSDNHIDLQTGTFRAIGDEKATLLLYGLPSSLGMGITTRGDIQPRIPNPFRVDALAAVNIAYQGLQAGNNIASAAFQADRDTGKAFMQALSLQSVSRPVARISELITGESITSKGNVVASGLTANPFAEEFTAAGLFARVMGTRPIKEVKAREAMHLDSTYEAADGDRRRALTTRLKTHVLNGDLDAEKIQSLQYEYMRTGSPTGWRSAVNEAAQQKVLGGDASVKRRFAADAPWQKMIGDLD